MSFKLRKVVYSALKPGTKTAAFLLLECGHVNEHHIVKKMPKRKRCLYCDWDEPYPGSRTIELIYWEHRIMKRTLHTIQYLFKDK